MTDEIKQDIPPENKAAIELLDKWLTEPVVGDGGALENFMNRMEDTNYMPKCGDDEIKQQSTELAQVIIGMGDNLNLERARKVIEFTIREGMRRAYLRAAEMCRENVSGQPLDKLARYDEGYDRACLDLAGDIREVAEGLEVNEVVK